MSDSEAPDARAWQAWEYEEVYKLDVRGRILKDGRTAIRAVLGSANSFTSPVGWSIAKELPDGSTQVASVQEALQNLALKLTGK